AHRRAERQRRLGTAHRHGQRLRPGRHRRLLRQGAEPGAGAHADGEGVAESGGGAAGVKAPAPPPDVGWRGWVVYRVTAALAKRYSTATRRSSERPKWKLKGRPASMMRVRQADSSCSSDSPLTLPPWCCTWPRPPKLKTS